MGEERRDMEGDIPVKLNRTLWRLRTWKRHDLILVVAGAMYVMIGVAFLFADPSPARDISLVIILRIAPFAFWAWVFIVVGIVSIISAKWPPSKETWGYSVLTGFSTGWGSAYLMGILFGAAPWTNLNGFLIWGMLGFLWWAISGLVNPDAVVVTADEHRSA